jgi:hypothetical protein
MENEFTTYEQSLALKELGFNEPCFSIYYSKDKSFSWHHHKDHTNDEPMLDNGEFNISAPLYQQAFRWFREKYKLVAAITVENDDFDYTIYIPWEIKEEHDSTRFTSYEEAEQACLDKLIEICRLSK